MSGRRSRRSMTMIERIGDICMAEVVFEGSMQV